MRKFYFYLLFLVMTIFVYSCMKDIPDVNIKETKKEGSLRISDLQKLFESTATDLSLPDLSLNGGSKTKAISFDKPVVPQWGRSRAIDDDKYYIYQIALEDGIKHAALKTYITGNDTVREVSRWFSRLVIKKSKMYGTLEMFIFTIVPDADYLIKNRDKVSALNFNEFNKNYSGDYSGIILFSDLEGRVTSGIRYVNGKIKHRLNTNTTSPIGIKGGVRVQPTFELCMHTVSDNKTATKGGDYPYDDPETCILDKGETWGWCDACSTAHWEENNDSTGDGLDWFHEAYSYTPSKGDAFANSYANSNWAQQIDNTCVTTSLSYINNMYGGNKNVTSFNDYCNATFGGNVSEYGVQMNNIQKLLNNFFEQAPFLGYQSAINNGCVVMSGLPNGVANEYHNVTVVGYNGSDLIYLDPDDGGLHTVNQSTFDHSIYNVVISGIK